jgi:hypothetical protein
LSLKIFFPTPAFISFLKKQIITVVKYKHMNYPVEKQIVSVYDFSRSRTLDIAMSINDIKHFQAAEKRGAYHAAPWPAENFVGNKQH